MIVSSIIYFFAFFAKLYMRLSNVLYWLSEIGGEQQQQQQQQERAIFDSRWHHINMKMIKTV